jgi:prevent-host-death family protein
MEVIGIRELRQHASRYLARVEGGEELGVTNKGRLVARLIPPREAERSREALVEAGVLVPARHSGNLLDIGATPARGSEPNLSQILDAMRSEQ